MECVNPAHGSVAVLKVIIIPLAYDNGYRDGLRLPLARVSLQICKLKHGASRPTTLFPLFSPFLVAAAVAL